MSRALRHRLTTVTVALCAAVTAMSASGQVGPDRRFGAWGLRCATAEADRATQRCYVSQSVGLTRDGGNVVLGVSVDHFDSPTVPTIHFRFTTLADRPSGIGVKIDQNEDLRLPIADCNASRCEAAARLSGDTLVKFRAGQVAQVAFIGPGGRQVTVPVSLEQFGAALDALRQRLATGN